MFSLNVAAHEFDNLNCWTLSNHKVNAWSLVLLDFLFNFSVVYLHISKKIDFFQKLNLKTNLPILSLLLFKMTFT